MVRESPTSIANCRFSFIEETCFAPVLFMTRSVCRPCPIRIPDHLSHCLQWQLTQWFGAGSTGHLYLLPHRVARPVDPYCSVSFAYARSKRQDPINSGTPTRSDLEATLCRRGDREEYNRRLAVLKNKNGCLIRSHSSILRRRSELVMTDTELKLIAAAAMIGESSKPKNGYKTPAAIGTPAAL
jgi:hypothetical protein